MSVEKRMGELADVVEQGRLAPRSELVEDLMPKEMPRQWNLSPEAMNAVRTAVAMAQTKHGLYASIPMVCKAEECPYAAVCPLINMDQAPKGERCPIEIATILTNYQKYTRDMQLDEENSVDMSLIRELIDLDIQQVRAENKLAIDADFIQETVVGISEKGEVMTSPQIHKAADYKERVMKKRHDILQLLHSTRKDKAGDKLTVQLDPSTYASQLMQQAAQMAQDKKRKIIDVESSE